MDFSHQVNETTDRASVFSVGQAGFIIKSQSGQLLGIDLYLSNCVEIVENSKAYKRLLPIILKPEEIIFDTVICTHFHRDHYDVDSIPVIMNNNKTKLFCAHDCECDVERQKIDINRTVFVSPGETYRSGDFILHFINCDHGNGAPLAVGVIIEVDGYKILYLGDTCLRIDRKDEYKSYGNLNVMIAPINGLYGNLNENECALLANELKPDITIPCHYGMFAGHGGNPGLFFNIMTEQYPQNKFLIMCQGEEYTLSIKE